jgi:hypothetical protein
MTTIEYLDRPPAGWFVLDVMPEHERDVMPCQRKRDWVALMIDADPDELKRNPCPWAYRRAREAWLRIPGKHRTRDAAWGRLQDMLATRH